MNLVTRLAAALSLAPVLALAATARAADLPGVLDVVPAEVSVEIPHRSEPLVHLVIREAVRSESVETERSARHQGCEEYEGFRSAPPRSDALDEGGGGAG